MNDTVKQIEELFPQGKEVTLKGKKVTVRPYGFGKFPKILKLLKDLKFGDEEKPTLSGATLQAAALGVVKMDAGALLVQNAEAIVTLCALAINEREEFFNDLPGDEGVKLCQAVIEVNADFFIARLQPTLLVALSGLSTSVGGLLSQSSSQAVTA